MYSKGIGQEDKISVIMPAWRLCIELLFLSPRVFKNGEAWCGEGEHDEEQGDSQECCDSDSLRFAASGGVVKQPRLVGVGGSGGNKKDRNIDPVR